MRRRAVVVVDEARRGEARGVERSREEMRDARAPLRGGEPEPGRQVGR